MTRIRIGLRVPRGFSGIEYPPASVHVFLETGTTGNDVGATATVSWIADGAMVEIEGDLYRCAKNKNK